MHDLTTKAREILDTISDEEIRTAEHLCAHFGIPAEYARNVAGAVMACLASEPGPCLCGCDPTGCDCGPNGCACAPDCPLCDSTPDPSETP